MENPYVSPDTYHGGPQGPKPAPGVVVWFRVYAVSMALLYVLLVIAGAFLALYARSLASGEEPYEVLVFQGVAFAVIGVPLVVLYVIGVFMPAKPWAWIYGIVLIGIGMTSCCLVPACVPLLIFWIRPEAQSYYGRSSAVREPAPSQPPRYGEP